MSTNGFVVPRFALLRVVVAWVVGGGETNDIAISSDQHISRTHARLRWNGTSWSIEKLAPQNTLTVNQQQVEQATISNNTTIGLGINTTYFFLVEPERPATSPVQAVPGSRPLPQNVAPPLYPAQ